MGPGKPEVSMDPGDACRRCRRSVIRRRDHVGLHRARFDPAVDRRRTTSRPGGILALSTGDPDSLVARLSGKRWHLLTPRHHNFFFTRPTIRALLERLGFAHRSTLHVGAAYSVRHLAYKLHRMVQLPGLGSLTDRLGRSRMGSVNASVNLLDIVTVIAQKPEGGPMTERVVSPAPVRRSRVFTDRLAVAGLLGAWVLVLGAVALRIDQGWVPHDDGAFAQSAERVLDGQLPHRDFTELYTGGMTLLNAMVLAVLGHASGCGFRCSSSSPLLFRRSTGSPGASPGEWRLRPPQEWRSRGDCRRTQLPSRLGISSCSPSSGRHVS